MRSICKAGSHQWPQRSREEKFTRCVRFDVRHDVRPGLRTAGLRGAKLTRREIQKSRAHGRALVSRLSPGEPPASLEAVLASCKLFVEHPIARMTGICAIIRGATPE